MARGPHRQVCQTCRDGDEFVTWEVEGPGLWRYTCSGPEHGGSGYAWLSTGRSPLDGAGHDGLSEQLGIYDDLLRCFHPGEPYLEYGVVEHRYATTNPDNYKHLVRLYSHTGLGPTEYSASAFIGAAIGKLGREGLLARVACKATGFWHYNGTLHAWALTPGPESGDIFTWHAHASSLGLDPQLWPATLLP